MSNFLKIGDRLLNTRYIKEVNCEIDECKIVVANTCSSGRCYCAEDNVYKFSKDSKFYDQIYHFVKSYPENKHN